MARKKKGNIVSVDMEGVSSGNKIPDGDHIFEIVEATVEKGKDSGKEYIKWKLKEVESGSNIYHNTSLVPEALFSLRSMLEACGVPIPESKLDIDLTDFVEVQLAGSVVNEVYDGKKRPSLVDVFPVEDGEESEEEAEEEPEEEEEEEKKPAKKSKKKAEKKEKKKPAKIKKGSKVTFDDEDDTIEAEVTNIKDGVYTVLDTDGDEWELELDDLKAA